MMTKGNLIVFRSTLSCPRNEQFCTTSFSFVGARKREKAAVVSEFYVCIKKGMKWHENKHFETVAKVLIMLKNYSRCLVRCRSFSIRRWQLAADEWLIRHFGHFSRLHWTLSEMNEPRWPLKLVHVKMGSWQLNFYDPKLFFNDLKIMQTDKKRRLYRRLENELKGKTIDIMWNLFPKTNKSFSSTRGNWELKISSLSLIAGWRGKQ